jgi:thioredoxin reductase (NADPH)
MMTTMQQNGHEPTVEDVVIIGSGPAGLTAGLYTARANLSPILFTGNDYGGQVSMTHEIENYPGFPEALSGQELVERMKVQAERFGLRVEFDHVTGLDMSGHPFKVHTASGRDLLTKSLILTTGARPRYLEVPGEHEMTGRGVSYCATCDGFFFRGQDVVVIGGGDSAVEEGLFLTKFATKVRIIHRREELRASQILQDRAFANEKIEFVWNTVVKSINQGENGKVGSITVENVKTGKVEELKTDGVFIFVGHIPNNELYAGELHMDEDGHLIADGKMRTNIPGVFAAGEIMDKVYKQVATSVGQGTAAAMQLEKWLADYEAEGYPGIFADPREFPQVEIARREAVPAD